MRTLTMGSRDPQVRLAQRMLNLSVTPKPPLKEDSAFGPKTLAALKQFQKDAGLPTTGQIDQTFWKQQGITIDIEHPVQLFPQPTNFSCWSAAATMLFGNMSVGPGKASLGDQGDWMQTRPMWRPLPRA